MTPGGRTVRRRMVECRCERPREKGSALLIVFVFAAIIAIYLYRELPVTAFEAKRAKEQLLVDRGHEYVRAIQLYYRRNRGQFPSSVEQLENTNNIRYLRKRYNDPFTGKDDWRLLHAGPNGTVVDSKVNPLGIGAPGQTPGVPGSSNSSSSISASSSGDTSSGDTVVVPPVTQRGPALQANGGGGLAGASSDQPPTSAQLDQNPDLPIVPPAAGSTGTAAGPPGIPGGLGRGARGLAGAAFAGTGPAGAESQGAANNTGQAGSILQTMSPLLSNPTSGGAQGVPGAQAGLGTAGSSTGAFGQLNGGGALAGVASRAKGRSIKVVDDQSDYSLWEFHYDPTKDTGLAGPGGQNPQLQGNTPGTQNGPQNTAQPGTSFGNQNANQTGFGQSASGLNSPPASAPAAPNPGSSAPETQQP